MRSAQPLPMGRLRGSVVLASDLWSSLRIGAARRTPPSIEFACLRCHSHTELLHEQQRFFEQGAMDHAI
jgi:hypothetical protein